MLNVALYSYSIKNHARTAIPTPLFDARTLIKTYVSSSSSSANDPMSSKLHSAAVNICLPDIISLQGVLNLCIALQFIIVIYLFCALLSVDKFCFVI